MLLSPGIVPVIRANTLEGLILAGGHVNTSVSVCDLWVRLTNIVKTMIINRECVRVWAQPPWLLLTWRTPGNCCACASRGVEFTATVLQIACQPQIYQTPMLYNIRRCFLVRVSFLFFLLRKRGLIWV